MSATADPTTSARQDLASTDVLLSVRGLEVHFPIKSGVVFERPIGAVKAVDGVDLDVPRGLDGRPGRRVRLRQDDLGPGGAAAGRADRRDGQLRRHRRAHAGGRRPAPDATPDADDLPGSDGEPGPPAEHRVRAHRAPARPRHRGRRAPARSPSCSTWSACRHRRRGGTRTSSPAASGNASASPARSRWNRI